MNNEKEITTTEIMSICAKYNIAYGYLEFGRIPSTAKGKRTLYLISDYGINADDLKAFRSHLDDNYGICVQVVATDNTKWIDRSFIWVVEDKP